VPRYERISVENRRFPTAAGWPKISCRRDRPPTNHSSSQNTRLNDLLYGIKMWTDLSYVLSQSTRLTDIRTDERTDRILIARPCLHSMQRGQKRWMHPGRDYERSHGMQGGVISISGNHRERGEVTSAFSHFQPVSACTPQRRSGLHLCSLLHDLKLKLNQRYFIDPLIKRLHILSSKDFCVRMCIATNNEAKRSAAETYRYTLT